MRQHIRYSLVVTARLTVTPSRSLARGPSHTGIITIVLIRSRTSGPEAGMQDFLHALGRTAHSARNNHSSYGTRTPGPGHSDCQAGAAARPGGPARDGGASHGHSAAGAPTFLTRWNCSGFCVLHKSTVRLGQAASDSLAGPGPRRRRALTGSGGPAFSVRIRSQSS